MNRLGLGMIISITNKDMRKFYRIAITGLIACLSILSSCEEQQEWGIKKVYMPQASLLNGGLTNEYPVPMEGLKENNYFIDEEGKMNIYLGVYRSGEGELSAFDVEVYADMEATNQAVNEISRAVSMPEGLYSFPSSVSVAEGQRQNNFILSIDLPRLIEEYPYYNKKRVALVVGLRNPSKWELNEDLCRTTVLVEGGAFMPVPPIIKNGNFGAGASENWTIVNVNNKPFELMTIDESKGELQIAVENYSVIGGDSRFMCYQKLDSPDLQVGNTYVMSADINIPVQDFYMSANKQSLKREMDLGFALFPNNTNMQTQNDYKPSGNDAMWYMDVTMDNGKGHYPLIEGTDGFVPFSSIHINKRPATIGSGEFVMDEAHMGGYIVFYVRLRNPCPGVKPISITNVSIVEK